MPFDLKTAKPVSGFDLSTAKPVAETPKEDTRTFLQKMLDEFRPENLKRAAGLTGRTIVEGATDLALLSGELATSAYNLSQRHRKPYTVTLDDGTKRVIEPGSPESQLQSPSADRDALLEQAGLPQPREGIESATAAVGRGAVGALTGSGIASQIAKAAAPLSTTQKVAQVVADAPTLAAVSGGTSAVSSDIARQAGASPGVQLAAGLAGGVAPSARTLTAAALRAVPKSATRTTAEAAKDEAVRILLENEIPLTTAQRGNHKVIGSAARAADTVLGPSEFGAKQQAAFNRAVLKRAGAEGEVATPEVMRDIRTRLGYEFDDLAETFPTKVDDELRTSLKEIADDAAAELDASALAPIEKQIRNLTDKAASGVIDGRAAQNARSSLGRLQSSANPSIKYTAGRIREALDEALERSAGPKDAARVRAVRDKYKAMKQIEDAVANNAEGNISPAKLFNVLNQKRNRGQSIYGKGDQSLVELARAGKQLLKEPVGNSGTATRGMDVAKIAAAITNPVALVKTVGGVAAGRALNEIQPIARRIGGTGVRKPVDVAPAQGALPPATLTAFAEDRRRKRKLRAAAVRAPVPFR